MTALAMRKTQVQALTPTQGRILKIVTEFLDLGDPAEFIAPGGVRWLAWDDHRFSLKDMAALGTITGNMAGATDAVKDNLDAPKQALRAWVQANWNLTPPPDGTANPWQWVLTNNGAPAGVQAATSVPANWAPPVLVQGGP